MKKGTFRFFKNCVFIHKIIIGLLYIILPACDPNSTGQKISENGLKDLYQDYYTIGVAISPRMLDSAEACSLIKTHFNSLTPENDMKWERIHPSLDEYDFHGADQLVEFGQANNMQIIGHTLVWHSQIGKGVFTDGNDEDETSFVDSATLMNRVKEHINTVVGRYKGKVNGWDVLNEALNENGTLRESYFLKIAGEGYIRKVFEFAHEADPGAELYYNDYNMVEPAKREGAIRMIKNLQAEGVKIDGVGLQAHWELDYPSLEMIEESILAYASLGVKVMFTEMDISVLPSPWRMPSADISIRFENNEKMNPFPDEMPDSISTELAKRYRDIFALFNKHSDKISRVTFWGLHDGVSWKNNFPIKGRTDYPLLFNREMKPKKAYWEVSDLVMGE